MEGATAMPRRTWHLSGLMLLAVVLMAAGPLLADVGFVWIPPSVTLRVPSGGSGSFRCEVMNSGNKTQRYRITVASIAQKEDGGYNFLTPDQPKPDYSCADWITANPQEVTLRPAESATITCSVRVPRGVAGGGRYAGVLCELPPDTPAQDNRAAQMMIVVNAATIVMLDVAGRRPLLKAKLASMEVRPAEKKEGGGLWFEGSLVNQGDMHVFGKGALVLRTRSGRRLAETQLGGGRGTVLPGATVKFRTLIKDPLPIGRYIAEGRIEYGGRGPAVAQTSFEVARATVLGSASEGLAVSVEPSPLSITVPPGGRRVVSAVVFNQDDRNVHVKAHTADLSQDSLGRLNPAEQGERVPSSARGWTTLRVEEFDLRPGERRSLPIMVTVPREEQPGGRYAAVVLEATGIGPSGRPANTMVFTALLLTVRGKAEPKLEVARMTLLPAQPGSGPAFNLTLRNPGNLHVPLVQTSLAVTERTTGLVKKSWRVTNTLTDQVLLPGAERTLITQLDVDVPVGAYTAQAEVSYGAKEPMTKSLDFEVRAKKPGTPVRTAGKS